MKTFTLPVIALFLSFNLLAQTYYSEDFEVSGNPTEKIIQVVNKLGGDIYVSGTAGRNYIDESLFSDIKLEYMEYKTENKFTVLDNIFNNGIDIL